MTMQHAPGSRYLTHSVGFLESPDGPVVACLALEMTEDRAERLCRNIGAMLADADHNPNGKPAAILREDGLIGYKMAIKVETPRRFHRWD